MTEFKLPELGENIDQGDLVRLMVSPGASVTEGQPVMELETDKAVVEVPSSVTGTVKEIRVKEGQKIKVGQVIFTVENGAGAKVKAVESKACRRKRQQKRLPQLPKPRRRPKLHRGGSRCSAIPGRNRGATEFRLPELGENIDQGDLVRLMISPGAKVSEGQPVMELETDKAVVEVPSSVTGTVKEIKVKEGAEGQSRPGDFHPGRRRVGAAGEGEARSGRAHFRAARSAPVGSGGHCRPRERPQHRYFCPISRSRRRPKLLPCRSNWARWPGRSIARLRPPRLTSAVWREKSASIFTK